MAFQPLATKRLKLVRVTEEHTEALFEVLSDLRVTRFYGIDPLASIEEAEQIIGSFDQTFAARRGIRWGMVDRATGRFIGTVGLNNWSPYAKKAELGFELHPDFWRQGYGSEAVQEVIRFSFEELGLFRLGAVTFLENEASYRLLEKLGFTYEGVLRGYLYQDEQSHDARMYGRLRTDVVTPPARIEETV
ncbi:GNAT family N-acetyltransferase [Exiguobacterium sp. TDN 0502]|uniref:GNAT family N-acetyltransferase n=1 Tax=Exiguobacterium sp. TDN 0502 TaxID=3420731 RepID=UPI003D76C20B